MTSRKPYSCSSILLTSFLLAILVVGRTLGQSQVTLEVLSKGNGPPVTRDDRYSAHVTLYLDDGKKTPSGWSTRKENGAPIDKPYSFQPGVNLIQGWTEGVLQMTEGERALLHVPAKLGYGPKAMGRPGGAFYIPANSDLLFDIEILGKEEEMEL